MKTSSSLIKFDNGIDLECGVRLDSFELMVETYGELNEDKSNGILVCHAFSGNHHAAGVSEDKKDIGWWDNIIGPDKAVDTNKYFVVCSNNLGGCSGSSGPLSINPLSKKPYGKDFPSVSVVDWVNSQKQLSDYFGIKKWHIVLGGSLGGMQALQWSISFPESLNKAGIFAAAAKSSTQNIAMNEVGREAIRKDKNFIDGDYLLHDVKPRNGLKTARMLGHITYSSEAIMDEKFGRNFQDIKSKVDRDVDYQVENYLQYKGEKFSDIFDAIAKKENGGQCINHKSSKEEMFTWMREVLPEFDEDQVYHSDIKKLAQWYNILQENGLIEMPKAPKKAKEKTEDKK